MITIQDLKDLQVTLTKDLKVQRVHKDLVVIRVQQPLMDLKVIKVLKVQLVVKD